MFFSALISAREMAAGLLFTVDSWFLHRDTNRPSLAIAHYSSSPPSWLCGGGYKSGLVKQNGVFCYCSSVEEISHWWIAIATSILKATAIPNGDWW
ncbi:hypothetical protein ZIOFF_063692 [Zingiber officinale]|uniref:Uncharacterized protein n=1 Tax=Zingiber officinale TaxID=94328 RepID=A0A8J5F6P0_ZINOF|nr:hypothetical protein ZIOFF_063692 [Zingiber officinale]